jgi:DNA-binding transcriptional ArsR family regulator
MKAVYIVNDVKVAKVLVDPMRRAILDLLAKTKDTSRFGQRTWIDRDFS